MLARYKILHEIGRGATGAVYAAQDRTTGALVALKRLDPAFLDKSDAHFAERVLKQWRSARNLKHRNIVQVHEAGESAGTVYIAMEMVEGESLRKVLEQGPLRVATAIRIAHDVASALAYAHLEGVVHAGIKPSNIIILRSGVAKISDFGGSAGLSTLSPEQLRGDPIDYRSDIFSLGALLYEMLTQRPPFEGASPAEVLENMARARPPAPSELNPHVPRALDAIVLGMLAAQPDVRMPGMPILIRDLQRLEEGLGLEAPQASPEPVASAAGDGRDREVFEPHEAIAIMERESRLERPSRSRPAIFAVLALLIGVIGIGFSGLVEPTDLKRLSDLVDDWSGRIERAIAATGWQEALTTRSAPSAPTAPAPVAEAPKEPGIAVAATDSIPEEPPVITAAPVPPPPLPVAEPSPPAQPEATPARKARVLEPQPHGTATLILAVSPRGEIYINGEPHGTTPPITQFDLEPGMHRIEVRSGSRKPYLTYMTVRAGDVRRIRHDFNAKPVRPPR